MADIKMYTTTWCGDCRHAKRFLKEQGLDYEEVNIEEHEDAAEYVMKVNNGKRKVPTFVVGGRAFNLSPYDEYKLRSELGLERKG
ncbi:MAG: glutaredoxin family protein [Pyrinomonadaceae bacterium]